MPNLAEVKAGGLYLVGRYAGECALRIINPAPDLSQPLSESGQKNPSLVRAHTALFTYDSSTDPSIQAAALAELGQTHIDMAIFPTARHFLGKLERLLPEIPTQDRRFYQARFLAGVGWINMYETGYSKALDNFLQAREQLDPARRNFWSEDARELYWHTIHQEAMARLGLAAQGMDREANLEQARQGFNTDRDHFVQLRQTGDPHPVNEAFQDRGLAVISIMEGNYTQAHEYAELMLAGFREPLKPKEENGNIAQYHLIKGLIHLESGDPRQARISASNSIDIRDRSAPDRFRRGLALALVARSYRREGQTAKAIRYALQAVKSHPVVALYHCNASLAA